MRRFVLLSILLCLSVLVVRDSTNVPAAQGNTMTIKVYFGNEKWNPNAEPCGRVFPVNRVIPKTSAVAKAALEQLFAGPTEKEKAEGYFSYFSPESKSILKSIVVKKRAAYVNFKAETFSILSGNVTTSCGSSLFISEMETTLLQFPSIKKVFYAVEGKPADFYEHLQGECPPELGKNCSGADFK